MTITISTQDKRSVKALAVLNTSDRWHKGHVKATGRSFYAVPSSSDPNRFYLVDTRACTCPDHISRGVACCHILAVRLKVATLTGTRRPKTPNPLRAKEAWLPVEPPIDGTLAELALSTCRTCGQSHSSDAERRQSHAAAAADIWGSDGN